MPLSTLCPAHRRAAFRPHCPGCVQAARNITTLRKRRLDALSKERRERQTRERARDENRRYRALLASLKSQKRSSRVRWVKDPDGWPRCSKHGERLTARRRKNKPSHYCRACSRECEQRRKPLRLARKRRQLHDATLGTLHSIRSPLAQLIKTGIASHAANRKRS